MVIPEEMKVKPSIYAYRCHVIANADVYDSNVTTMEPLQEISREQKQSSSLYLETEFTQRMNLARARGLY